MSLTKNEQSSFQDAESPSGESLSASQVAKPSEEFLFSSRLPDWVWSLLLILATLLAYQPAWNGKPIWDDAAHLTYPHLQSLHGLFRIWTEPGVNQQYYPMVTTAFWVEHRLWGDSTLGYHLVNILLHAGSALLLLRILRLLDVPVAGLAAAIFALHPVQVESVAWISELKNTLSGFCYFGAALMYLRFDRTGKKSAYAIALALFAVGLMTKSVIATMPAALLVVLWWQRGKISWRNDVAPLIPFFAVALIAGYSTSWVEQEYVGAHGAGYNFSLVERCLIAGRALWFYLGKVFWPVNLIFSYPRWKISLNVWWQFLFPVAAAIALFALWLLRKRNRGPLAAALFFGGTLFPALGFLNVFPFKYSFVADHFQYLAACGPIVAGSVGIIWIARQFGERRAIWEGAFCAILLASLGVLTWRESGMYKDIETLWQTTIERNPESWLAYNDLGGILYARGQLDDAIKLFQKAVALDPDNAEAQNNLGAALDKSGQIDEAIVRFRKALAARPDFAEALCNLGNSLQKKGQSDEAITDFQKAVAIRPDAPELHFTLANALLQKGRWNESAAEFQKTLELTPEDSQAHYDLGIALHQKGDIDGATAEFQKAATIRPEFVEAQNNLGNSLLQKGRVNEAISYLRKAVETKPDYAQAHYNLGNAYLQKGATDDAITEFQKLLLLQPGSPQARGSLARIAWRLATSPVASQRNGVKALELAQEMDRLAGNASSTTAEILAAAYAETGQFEQAAAAAQRALELARSENNGASVAGIEAQLNIYKAGKPFRDESGGH
ncbi:MAG TPA: tetratricopeptide repeat protein [Verrucomicrobiae bacterium]